MDLHKLRILKFDDNSNKNEASRKDCKDTTPYYDKSPNPMNDNLKSYAKLAKDDNTVKFVSSERVSRPRKRKSYCKQRKSESDVSLSLRNKLKKHTRKRTLSMSDVKKTFKNSMSCYPIKQTFDLLSGDSELHVKNKRRHRKKRKRHNKISKDIKIMFICETPRTTRKSRKRSKNYGRKDSSSPLRSSDDIFGFQKRNRTLSQYLYTANCNYFNTIRKFKIGLQRKKKGCELQPRHKHTRVRILSTDYLSSIESSLKHYSIVNTCRTNNGKCVKLHSHSKRKTETPVHRPTIDKNVSVAPSSFVKIGKSFYNSSVGKMKSCTRPSRSNGTQCQYHRSRTQENGMRRPSHDGHCPIHDKSNSFHEELHPLEGSACICTQYPSGSNVDAAKCETNKINQTDEYPCGTRTCIKNQYKRLYARVLEKFTTLYTSPQTVAKNVVKYAFLGVLIIIWCPCILAISLAWMIAYPLKLQHVTTVDKAKKPSTISSLLSKFRKNHRGPENERIFNEDCSYPKRKGFLSWLSNWSSHMADNIAKSIDTLMSIFKINKNKPVSESSLCVPKHPNPEKKYSLFYQDNRGWLMKPKRSQEVSTLYHRNQVVQNVDHGCRFDAFRHKLARKKKYKEQQGSSLFRSPPTNNNKTMPTCWGTKPVRSQTLPCNQVITLPPALNLNSLRTRNSMYTDKKRQISNIKHIADTAHRPLEIKSKELSDRKPGGVNTNAHSIKKCAKSTQSISRQNVTMSRQYPTYAFANKYRPHPKPCCFPNQRTKLRPIQNNAQSRAQESGLKIIYNSMNTEPNIPSVLLHSSNNMSLDKRSCSSSKCILSSPSKISLTSLSSRHINLKPISYQICLTKLQCTVNKLSKYLERAKLTDRCLNEKNAQDSQRLECIRKQRSNLSPTTNIICKCSGDNNLIYPNKASNSLYNSYQKPLFSGPVDLVQLKQRDSLHLKCTCLDNKINSYLSKDERHSLISSEHLQGLNEEACSCLSNRKATPTDKKYFHRPSKIVNPEYFKHKGPEDDLKAKLHKYLSERLSSNVTERPIKNIARFMRKAVDKLYMKNSKNIRTCSADSKTRKDNVDKQLKQQIKEDAVGCPYCKRIMKRNHVECECSKELLHLTSKRQDPGEPDKNRINLRSGAVCKCQIVKQTRVSEKHHLLPQFSFFKNKQDKKHNTMCECLVNKQSDKQISSQQDTDYAISKKNKRKCGFPSTLPKKSNSVGKKQFDKNKPACECPLYSHIKSQSNKLASKKVGHLCECPLEKPQLLPRHDKNNVGCVCPLHRRLNDSQSHPNKRAIKNVKQSRLLCEYQTEQPQFLPHYDEINLECQCPLYRSQPNKLASEKIKQSGPPCKCPTEKPKLLLSNNKHSLMREYPRPSQITDAPPQHYKIASDKTTREHALCDCPTEKDQYIPCDVQPSEKNKARRNSGIKFVSNHEDPLVNSRDCESSHEEAQRESQLAPINKKQVKNNNKMCPCAENRSQFQPFKIPPESVNRNGMVCKCPTRISHLTPNTLLLDKSLLKPAHGSHIECTCLGEYSKSHNYPNKKVPLRSRKSDKVPPKSFTPMEMTKSSQQPLYTKCDCSHKTQQQSNHSIKSDKKINLKRSFEKLHLKLNRYFSGDVECTCSSEKLISEQVSKLARPNFGKTPSTTKNLPKSSSYNVKATNSPEKIGYLQKSGSKIHADCMCSGDKIKRPCGKESDLSLKSRNESSQRVRFEPLEIPKLPTDARQPKPVNSNKCACPNDGSLTYHPLKLRTGKTNIISSEHSKLSQRASSSSKEKITNALRNTIDKLHSMLGRYISSDMECMCPGSDDLYKDSQHHDLADKTGKKKSELVLNKGVSCSYRHNKTLVDKPNNALFQYPPRQQAISPAKQRSSPGQVTTTKCSCSNEVQHRYVETPSHPIHRMRAVSTQWIQSANDPCRLPPRCHTPSAKPLPRQPVLRSQHRLTPQVVNICTPTCISKRRRPWPPGSRLSYPTLIPDPLCRQYAVKKQVVGHQGSKRKTKRTSFGKTCCTYCTKIKRAIVNADKDMWPNDFNCDRRMYVHTLRRKPCYCIFKCCPSMYPCFLTIWSLSKSFCTMILYVVTLICWCPFFCCVCLFCEDICCCLRRR